MKQVEIDGIEHFEFQGPHGVVRVPIEFRSRHRLGLRSDLLARALGKKRSFVLDLTAGLGRDSLHLAEISQEVIALERNSQLALALQNAWQKSGRTENLTFLNRDAREFLSQTGRKADVIFYDPMFPQKKKSALAGKESQLLQMMNPVSEPEEEKEILALARSHAVERVVVKRAREAPSVDHPDVVFTGKSIRYDVYLCRNDERRDKVTQGT